MASEPLLARRRAHEDQRPIKFSSLSHLLSPFRRRSKDCPAERLPLQHPLKFFSLSHLLSLFRRRNKDCPAERLPALLDVPTPKRPLLFILKLALCSIVFDCTDPLQEPEEKEMKTQTLLELTEYLSAVKTLKKLDKAAIKATYHMVSVNIFRSLPASTREVDDVEEEQPGMDPSWPHLQLVYDFLLVFLSHSRTIKYADGDFLLRFLDLFKSKDPRERDYLKKGLHQLYGRSLQHRIFLRKAFRSIFHRVVLETEKHNGLAEILEIVHSIIHGFNLPLKEEHKLFLLESLIPLHTPKWLWMYHRSLCACTANFVEKDPKLAGAVIRGLLDLWPVTNSRNEVLMLEELVYVLEVTQLGDFQSCMVPVFQQINRSLMSSHMEVVEGALKLWNNEHVVSMIAQNGCVILPFIFGAIEGLSDGHENQAVRGLAQNVRKMFQDLDKELFQECLKAFCDKVKVEAAFAANTPTVKLVLAK